MIIRMFNMSPETLRHREVGNAISTKDKRIIETLDDNITYIESHIKYGDGYGNNSEIDHIDIMDEDFDPALLDDLTKEACYKLIDKINKTISYYASGHEFIKGVDNVLDNIELMIDMKNDLSFAKKLNLTVAGNGSTYDKSEEGVIPEGMTFLFNYRKSVKTEMNEKKRILQDKIALLGELEESQ